MSRSMIGNYLKAHRNNYSLGYHTPINFVMPAPRPSTTAPTVNAGKATGAATTTPAVAPMAPALNASTAPKGEMVAVPDGAATAVEAIAAPVIVLLAMPVAVSICSSCIGGEEGLN